MSENQDQNPKEPILREEYERRHKVLSDRYESYARRSTRILGFLVVVVLATAALSTYLLHENGQRTKDINDSLATNCIKTGNPLRSAVQLFGVTLIEKTEDDIRQSVAFEKAGTYKEIFPSYPSDKLHKLLVSNREDERIEIKKLRRAEEKADPINCEERFSHP